MNKELLTKDNVKVSIEDFQVSNTYSGFIEGRIEVAVKIIKKNLKVQLSNELLYGEGLYTNIPKWKELPPYTVKVRLKSLQDISGKGDYSCLYACWFIESLDEKIETIVQAELQKIKWNRYAKENYWENL